MNEHRDTGANAPIDPITTTLDEDLVLFHYRDGLPPERMEQIASALDASPELRARYADLCLLLDASSRAPVPRPADGLEDRLWTRLQARMAAEPGTTPRRRMWSHAAANATSIPAASTGAARHARASASRPWAIAAALMVALALGIVIGGIGLPLRPAPAPAPLAGGAAPVPTQPATPATAADDSLAPRVLDAYVAAHLRASQGLLLTTLNADEGTLAAAGPQLAATLVESNRLYAAAADRAGDTRLAALLRQLEPLLIEVANPPPADGIEVRKGLRDYVRESDLLFRLRATEARLDTRHQRRA